MIRGRLICFETAPELIKDLTLRLFLLFVVEVGRGEESNNGEEEVYVAFDALDGEHGDGLEDYEEAERREEAAAEFPGAHCIGNQFSYRHQQNNHMVDNHNPDSCEGSEVIGNASDGGTQ